ncbi:hypothetical protein H696_03407, partial [Fonticula alba]
MPAIAGSGTLAAPPLADGECVASTPLVIRRWLPDSGVDAGLDATADAPAAMTATSGADAPHEGAPVSADDMAGQSAVPAADLPLPWAVSATATSGPTPQPARRDAIPTDGAITTLLGTQPEQTPRLAVLSPDERFLASVRRDTPAPGGSTADQATVAFFRTATEEAFSFRVAHPAGLPLPTAHWLSFGPRDARGLVAHSPALDSLSPRHALATLVGARRLLLFFPRSGAPGERLPATGARRFRPVPWAAFGSVDEEAARAAGLGFLPGATEPGSASPLPAGQLSDLDSSDDEAPVSYEERSALLKSLPSFGVYTDTQRRRRPQPFLLAHRPRGGLCGPVAAAPAGLFADVLDIDLHAILASRSPFTPPGGTAHFRLIGAGGSTIVLLVNACHILCLSLVEEPSSALAAEIRASSLLRNGRPGRAPRAFPGFALAPAGNLRIQPTWVDVGRRLRRRLPMLLSLSALVAGDAFHPGDALPLLTGGPALVVSAVVVGDFLYLLTDGGVLAVLSLSGDVIMAVPLAALSSSLLRVVEPISTSPAGPLPAPLNHVPLLDLSVSADGLRVVCWRVADSALVSLWVPDLLQHHPLTATLYMRLLRRRILPRELHQRLAQAYVLQGAALAQAARIAAHTEHGSPTNNPSPGGAPVSTKTLAIPGAMAHGGDRTGPGGSAPHLHRALSSSITGSGGSAGGAFGLMSSSPGMLSVSVASVELGRTAGSGFSSGSDDEDIHGADAASIGSPHSQRSHGADPGDGPAVAASRSEQGHLAKSLFSLAGQLAADDFGGLSSDDEDDFSIAGDAFSAATGPGGHAGGPGGPSAAAAAAATSGRTMTRWEFGALVHGPAAGAGEGDLADRRSALGQELLPLVAPDRTVARKVRQILGSSARSSVASAFILADLDVRLAGGLPAAGSAVVPASQGSQSWQPPAVASFGLAVYPAAFWLGRRLVASILEGGNPSGSSSSSSSSCVAPAAPSSSASAMTTASGLRHLSQLSGALSQDVAGPAALSDGVPCLRSLAAAIARLSPGGCSFTDCDMATVILAHAGHAWLFWLPARPVDVRALLADRLPAATLAPVERLPVGTALVSIQPFLRPAIGHVFVDVHGLQVRLRSAAGPGAAIAPLALGDRGPDASSAPTLAGANTAAAAQRLLHNLIVFDRARVADRVCAINQWDRRLIALRALALGLAHRQLDAVRTALADIQGDQLSDAIALCVEALRGLVAESTVTSADGDVGPGPGAG